MILSEFSGRILEEVSVSPNSLPTHLPNSINYFLPSLVLFGIVIDWKKKRLKTTLLPEAVFNNNNNNSPFRGRTIFKRIHPYSFLTARATLVLLSS